MNGLDKQDPHYEHHMLEGLWAFQSQNVVNQPLLERMLESAEPKARAAATRVLCYWRDRIENPFALLRERANDEDPLVRLETVRAASFFDDYRAAEVALEALKHPVDPYLQYVLDETFKQLDSIWKKAINDGVTLAADNPAGVDYLLRSVNNSELAKLPRTPTVMRALLSRPNILHDDRHEALMSLAMANKTNMMTELLAAMQRLDQSDSTDARLVLLDLAHMFTQQGQEVFNRYRGQIQELAKSGLRPETRRVAYVTLVEADKGFQQVWPMAQHDAAALRDLIGAIPWIPDPKLRAQAYPLAAPLLGDLPASIEALFDQEHPTVGRYVRISLPRRGTLTLAEVQVFSDGRNVALRGKASQSATSHGGVASRAIDGNTDGVYGNGSQTHTPENSRNPWWEVDLGGEFPIDSIVVFNRTEGGGQFAKRLDGFTVEVLGAGRSDVFKEEGVPAPAESATVALQGDPVGTLRRAAIEAVASTGVEATSVFRQLAGFVEEGKYRDTAISALSRLPRNTWPDKEVSSLANTILAHLRQLPAAERTTDTVLDELALGNRLTSALPRDDAVAMRKALRELGVNVIRLRPIPHRMLYDRNQLFVEAGRDAEIIFENVDIMPHNVVVVTPGSLAKVGLAAEAMASRPDAFERNFIPALPEVLFGTKLVQPGQTDRVRFKAPSEVGEYPFVCTFPGHWRRMYGVLHVVENLDDVPPEAMAPAADPEIQSRPFVRSWTLADFKDDLEAVADHRDFARAAKLFEEISCVKCHRMNTKGGLVGPDLAGVKEKIAKGDFKRLDVLREMLEPSAKMDEKYRTLVVVNVRGRVHTGIVAGRDDEKLQLLVNPLDQQEPITLAVEEIDEEIPSQISLMPMGLLNTLTKEEILDLLLYIETAADAGHPAFSK